MCFFIFYLSHKATAGSCLVVGEMGYSLLLVCEGYQNIVLVFFSISQEGCSAVIEEYNYSLPHTYTPEYVLFADAFYIFCDSMQYYVGRLCPPTLYTHITIIAVKLQKHI